MLVNVTRPVPPQCIAFVQRHEGCRLHAYPDAKGVPTIGWGHTGPQVHLGLVWDQATADANLAADLHTAASALERKVGEACVAELTDNQYSALISFVYNLGTGDPSKPDWQIWTLLRNGKFDQVPPQFARFVYCGGHKLQDLVDRRAEEQKLFATGEPGTLPGGMASGTTRTVDTPPAEPAVKPLTRSKSFLGSCIAAVCTAGSAVAPQVKSGADAASNAIAPYVGKSEILQGISSHLALVAAAAALAVPALLWLKQHEAKTS